MATVFVQHHLPEELQPMPFALRFMDLLGLWGSWKRFYRFLAIFALDLAIIMFPKLVLGMETSDYGAIAKGISEILFELVFLSFMVVFILKRRSFESLIRELNDLFYRVSFADKCSDCKDIIRNQNVRMKKIFDFIVIYCTSGSFGYCLPSVCISHWRYWTATNSSETLHFDLSMEQEFYGLQIRTNFVHYHIFLVLSLLVYVLTASFSVIKIATPLLMLTYNTMAYRIVVKRVQKMSEYSKIQLSELKQIVELHNQAFRITDFVEDICQIPMAVQFLNCILFYCLIMFYASTNIDFNLLNVMIIFWLSLIETAGYAYLGTQLTEAAESVGAAIYDLPWYEHSVELQQCYRLMIQRAQRKTCITGGKFFHVELASFSSVLNTSYSYYLVLKDVLN